MCRAHNCHAETVQPARVMADTGQMVTPIHSGPTEPKVANVPGPGLWFSIITLSIGVGIFTWGAWQAYNTAFETLSVPAFDLPGSETRNLSAGEYEIYVRTGSAFDFGSPDTTALPSLDEIVVTNMETNETMPLRNLFVIDPVVRGTNRYDSVASFTVEIAGPYRVEIDSTSEANRALFARSLETGLEQSISWAIFMAVGFVVFLIGTVLLIVGMVRRNTARKTAVGPPSSSWLPPETPPSAPPRTVTARAPPPPPTPGETQTPWDD